MRFAIAIAAFLGISASAGLAAGELQDFNAAVEKASSHNRVAIGYLRTGNTDLAAIEIDRMREAWGVVTSHRRPPEFDGVQQLYTNTLLDVSTRLVAAAIMINSGRGENARQSLDGARSALSTLRKAAGVTVLADCIGDANVAMNALMVYDDPALDWANARTRADLAAKAERYADELTRCERQTDERTRANPEFRRLVDGAKASLALMPKAIETRNTDLLHRLLIELRSFDNLLAFRYG